MFRKAKGERYNITNLFEGERYLNTGGADGFFIITDLQEIDNEYFEIRNLSKEGKKDGLPRFKIHKRFLKPLIKDITKTEKMIVVEEADA